ncbi:energy-coupling factor transporter transmembrane protein EcfT [Synergistales bacterium]|nr:energy-coupling factor transporter transmembrane protein EcfT [Synergistales bacterium]
MAFASISMGQYVPIQSYVHSLDPRAKLLLLVVLLVAVFPASSLVSIAVWGLVLCGIARAARITLGMLLRSCRPVLFLAFFTFILNAASVMWRDGDAGDAFLVGLFAASRLILLVSFAVLLPLTTAPLEMADGFESLLSPFARLGFPAHECAMMMGIALRFIPLLTDEADRVVKAQLSRGAKLDQGNFIRRMVAFFPILIPLFVIIFRRADELALAMEARGYRGGVGRTKRRPLSWKKQDTRALIFVILPIVAISVFRIAYF